MTTLNDIPKELLQKIESLVCEDKILVTYINVHGNSGSKLFSESELDDKKWKDLCDVFEFQKECGPLIICGNDDIVEKVNQYCIDKKGKY